MQKNFLRLLICALGFSAPDNPLNAQEIRDIRPPVLLPRNFTFAYIFLAVIAAAGIFFIARWIKRRLRVKEELRHQDLRPAWQIAYDQLEELQARGLVEQGEIKQYYSDLSDIVRQYIEGRFSIRAPEMTTEEFLQQIRSRSVLTQEQKVYLTDFLNSCDMVKFARHVTGQEESRQSFYLARRLVDETKPQGEE